jgi:hypothetical protein
MKPWRNPGLWRNRGNETPDFGALHPGYGLICCPLDAGKKCLGCTSENRERQPNVVAHPPHAVRLQSPVSIFSSVSFNCFSLRILVLF